MQPITSDGGAAQAAAAVVARSLLSPISVADRPVSASANPKWCEPAARGVLPAAIRWSGRERDAEPGGLVSLRHAMPGDAAAILYVERVAFRGSNDGFNSRQIRRLLANPRAHVAVAEVGGVVGGWCVNLVRTHARSRSGRVYSIAVDPQHTGRGIGRSLLDWSLGELGAAGANPVYLEVRASNTAAITLYESAGFRAVARIPGYYSDEAGLRMRRG